ncbi:MAG: hypothetical protein CL920_01580 [Deltaproteobacteria bacterium]|nr:hypothetical protein [Deltaproteobacteria bacterium]MBU47373.1 hypothetical protein [Deltaproteobacteria bacterium]
MTNKRLLTYYSSNAGAGWTSAGNVSYTALGAASFSHRFTQSASNSSIIVGWRNGNAGGITQIYNNGKSLVRRLSIANVSNGFNGICNKTGTCSVYALYRPSSTSYSLRLYGSTNGGSSWSTGLNLTGNVISVYQHYWSGNYFFLRIRYRSGTTGSYYYRLYRSTDGRSFSLVRNSTASFSINAINKNIIQLSGSPPMQSTNGGSSFSPGVPSIYRLPNVSGCRRAGNTAIFCSSCPTNIDPKLASGLFPCHGIPYGATTTPTRSNPSPTGNTYFWIDTYYIYVHKR